MTEPAPQQPRDSADVQVIAQDGREILLVGTAHVSRESADLVRELIHAERPDRVCIELDAQRYQALSSRRRWEELDLREVTRKRQLAPLLANLVLAAYQKKLGGALGVAPGSELVEAARAAESLGIPVELCDRDVRVTLRRVWASLSLWKKSQLLGTLAAALLDRPEIDEETLRRLRDQDVLSELMRELGEALPGAKTALIDERDAYLAQKIHDAGGRKVVAVVGAGHVAGIRRLLEEHRPVDLAALSTIPAVPAYVKWIGWAVPVLVFVALAVVGVRHGAQAVVHNALFFVLATGIPTSIGAACALAHPGVVVSAFGVAPFTALHPLLGAGHVLAFLQAWLVPPVVRELENVADDAAVPRRWWSNRLLRIFLVFLLTTIGGMIGTYVGGAELIRNLF
ncbi:MAG TPA: TraB/GumN family protein [Myxococcota bacterium]|nr:TraB/GumN family protein [Myxococcota bacterium]